jgi:hypothetical protein
MTPEAWSRVKTILADALDVSADARPAYLDAACAGDASLRREVESLIVAQAAEWEFFDSPAPMPPAPEEAPVGPPSRRGERIGPYELISELGRGGMGMVYLARRADAQFEKKVAIKLIRPGMASDFALERFLSERQILASLEHPHIAGLLDGGATGNGEPYFVLEYVEGEPLMDYCETRDVRWRGGCGSSRRSATRCSTRTRTSSCIATSSPAMSSSPPKASRSCSTSESPSSSTRWARRPRRPERSSG